MVKQQYDITKQPHWVQGVVDNLKREIEELQQENINLKGTALNTGSRISYMPLPSMHHINLPEASVIRHCLVPRDSSNLLLRSKNEYIDTNLDRDSRFDSTVLCVRGERALIVLPITCNSIEVRLVKR